MTIWKERSELTVIHLVNAALAAFLFASPWLFGYSGTTAATWTACVLGAIVALVALASVIEPRTWEGWANRACGTWRRGSANALRRPTTCLYGRRRKRRGCGLRQS